MNIADNEDGSLNLLKVRELEGGNKHKAVPGTLILHIASCSGLIPADSSGNSDPYVAARLGDKTKKCCTPADATKKHRDGLRLQDPLDVGRDLGAVLTRRTSAQLRYACLETYVHLVASTTDADESAPRPERAFPFLSSAEE